MLNINYSMLNNIDKMGYITSFLISPCCSTDTRHSCVGHVSMFRMNIEFLSMDGKSLGKFRIPEYFNTIHGRQTEFDHWARYLQNWAMRPVEYLNADIGPIKDSKIKVSITIEPDGHWDTGQNALILILLKPIHDASYYGLYNNCYGYYGGRKGCGRNWGYAVLIDTPKSSFPDFCADEKNYSRLLNKGKYLTVQADHYRLK